MQQFVLSANIRRHEAALLHERSPQLRATLKELLDGWRRDLARLSASTTGVVPRRYPGMGFDRARLERQVRSELERLDGMWFLLDPRPGLHVVSSSASFAEAVDLKLSNIEGRPLFDVFPDNPDDPAATGMVNLYNSIAEASKTGRVSRMAQQRYDVRDEHGVWHEHVWLPRNEAVLNDQGAVMFVLHRTERIAA